MKYYIDGHNLIPKIPGMSLADFDDEDRLIDFLCRYAGISRSEITVFFDNAPDGMPASQKRGQVQIRYISHRMKADEAIEHAVKNLGRRAAEITVISSDAHVQTECRHAGAKVEKSEAFSRKMTAALDSAGIPTESKDRTLSAEETDYWLKLFGEK